MDDEITSLETALRVIQNRLNELIVNRNDELLKKSEYYGQRKTKKLAAFFGDLGYRILDFKSKEEKTPEHKMALQVWKVKDVAVPFMKSVVSNPKGVSVTFDLPDGAQMKTDFLNLCKVFKDLEWIDYPPPGRQLTVTRRKSKKCIPFMNGGWAELVNRSKVLTTLSSFAKDHSCSYDVFPLSSHSDNGELHDAA